MQGAGMESSGFTGVQAIEMHYFFSIFLTLERFGIILIYFVWNMVYVFYEYKENDGINNQST